MARWLAVCTCNNGGKWLGGLLCVHVIIMEERPCSIC